MTTPRFELTSQRQKVLRLPTEQLDGATGFYAIQFMVKYNIGISIYGHSYSESIVTHIARVWINRVRLPILLVVS